MDCQEAREHLKALNAQPATADDAVARHLAECPECAAFFDEQDLREAILKQSLSELPGGEQWRRHEAAVRGSLNAFERRRTFKRWAWVSTAAAAMLAFAAWSVYSLGNSGPSVAKAPDAPLSTDVAHSQQPTANSQQPSSLTDRVAKLQETVRSKQVLDELEQLQITFETSGDADGKSLAEDAELYVERIMSIDVQQPDQAREILDGIRRTEISARLATLRDSLSDDAPAPIQDSVKLAQTTLAEASQLGQ